MLAISWPFEKIINQCDNMALRVTGRGPTKSIPTCIKITHSYWLSDINLLLPHLLPYFRLHRNLVKGSIGLDKPSIITTLASVIHFDIFTNILSYHPNRTCYYFS